MSPIEPQQASRNYKYSWLTPIKSPPAECRSALKAVNIKSASVASGELEAEGGCLIYSFDIQIPGKQSIVEVAVDAGTGKVLAKKHEGPNAQNAEKAADAAATR